jgi:two-component system sensor histidine kinase MprB
MTLKSRVAAAAGGTAALCLVLVAVLAFLLERQDLRTAVDTELVQRSAAVTEALVTTGDIREAVAIEPLGIPAIYAQAIDAQGKAFPLTSVEPVLPVTPRALEVAAGRAGRYFEDIEVQDVRVRMLTVPAPGGAVQVAEPIEAVDLHLLHVAALLALLVLFGTGVATAVGRGVARAALRPVRQLADEAEAITAPWVPGRQLALNGDGDLRRLASSLNELLQARDNALRSQQRLIADAAHELRTPLTSVQANLEMLVADGARPPQERLPVDERVAMAADLRQEVRELTRTVNDLLELAREQDLELEPEEVALDEVLEECAAWCRRHHPDVEIRLTMVPVTVTGFRSQIARLVGNLLDNAAKWTAPGTSVDVRLDEQALQVRDHGPGVAAEDVPFVFERFYRATRARQGAGSGLGLAIVARVAESHGWSVQVGRAADGPGAVFVVRHGGTVVGVAGRVGSPAIVSAVSSSPS